MMTWAEIWETAAPWTGGEEEEGFVIRDASGTIRVTIERCAIDPDLHRWLGAALVASRNAKS